MAFLDVRPDLQKYYKPDLNGGKLMNECSIWDKVFLTCDVCGRSKRINGGNYTMPNRLNHSFSCVYCLSLGVNNPALSKEWHVEKNGKLTPFNVKKASNKKVWWKCTHGHEWEAQISKRTISRRGCPICKNSRGENEIANYLNEIGLNYRPQYYAKIYGTVRHYDFYLPDLDLYIEVHGRQHFKSINYFKSNLAKQQEIDKQKREYAEENGYYIMVDYKEHNPVLAVEGFEVQFNHFLDRILNDEIM